MSTESRVLRAPFSPIVSAINKIVFKSVQAEPRPEAKAPEQISAPVMFPGYMRAMMRPWEDLWTQRRGRVRIARDCWKIYDTDPDLKSQIRRICATAAKKGSRGSPFQVEITSKTAPETETAKLLDWTNEFIKRPGIRLHKKVKTFARWMLNEGSAFGEIRVAWPEKEVVEFRRIRGIKEGFVMMDEKDQIGNVIGYKLVDLLEQKIVALYDVWQIVPMHWEQEGDHGRPLIDSAITKFKRLDKMEETLAIARQEAYIRIARIFDKETPEPMMKSLMEREQQITEEAGTSVRDMWANFGVNVIDPQNTALRNIPDIYFLKNQLLSAGDTPKALLGGHGEEVNRATLDRQMEGHGSTADDVCDEVGEGYEQVIKLQWLLWGVDPSKFDLSLKWTEKTTETEREKTVRIDKLVRTGVYTKRRARIEADLDPDQEQQWEEEEAERDAELMFVNSGPGEEVDDDEDEGGES